MKETLRHREASEAEQDYLEAIHELIETRGYAKAVEIAEKLRLKRPTVTRMIQKLSREGFLKYEKYRGIMMTAQGKVTATEMKHRHQLLREFLMDIGVDAKTADTDAEGMEHHISKKTLTCLENWLAKSRSRKKEDR